jgi:hypothetical protein
MQRLRRAGSHPKRLALQFPIGAGKTSFFVIAFAMTYTLRGNLPWIARHFSFDETI